MKLLVEDILNHLELDKSKEIVESLSKKIIGRVALTKDKEHQATHILYIIKQLMGNECKKVLDIGTLWGGSIMVMMQSEFPSYFVSVDCFDGFYKSLTGFGTDPATESKEYPDGITNTIERVDDNISFNNVHDYKYDLIEGSSHDKHIIKEIRNLLNNSVDLLFIDGDHTKKGVIQDWNDYSDMVTKGGIVIFDDYWTGELSKYAWKNKTHWDEPERMDIVGAYEEIKSESSFSEKWIEVGLIKDKKIIQRRKDNG